MRSRRSHPPRQADRGGGGSLVRLPGRVACLAGLGASLPGGVKGHLGAGEAVAGHVERRLGTLHRAWAPASASSAAASLPRRSASCRIASWRARAGSATSRSSQVAGVNKPGTRGSSFTCKCQDGMVEATCAAGRCLRQPGRLPPNFHLQLLLELARVNLDERWIVIISPADPADDAKWGPGNSTRSCRVRDLDTHVALAEI